MTVSDYFRILGLEKGCTVDEIKKAYRIKARLYHPDINPSPEAKDRFIAATEAYEFLLTYREKVVNDDEAFKQAMDDWRKYRQYRSRRRARVYANASYKRFTNTSFYKTSRIFDGTTIILAMVISIMVLVITVSGYFYRLHHPVPGLEKPSVFVLIEFILFGSILFGVSYIFMRAYLQGLKKNKPDK
jgi:uncharacterized membrane protein